MSFKDFLTYIRIKNHFLVYQQQNGRFWWVHSSDYHFFLDWTVIEIGVKENCICIFLDKATKE